MIVHLIAPIYDTDSEILILGSFPSVKSREAGFYYGHPQNRFWKVLAGVYEVPVPVSLAEKTAFLTEHHIALWDVIASCDITGSSDTSIRNVTPNNLTPILETAQIRRILTNGAKSDALYQKYLLPRTGIPALRMPSTSPANAQYSLEHLTAIWKNAILTLS